MSDKRHIIRGSLMASRKPRSYRQPLVTLWSLGCVFVSMVLALWGVVVLSGAIREIVR